MTNEIDWKALSYRLEFNLYVELGLWRYGYKFDEVRGEVVTK